MKFERVPYGERFMYSASHGLISIWPEKSFGTSPGWLVDSKYKHLESGKFKTLQAAMRHVRDFFDRVKPIRQLELFSSADAESIREQAERQAHMKEFEKQLRRLKRISETPWPERAKKFGKSWVWLTSNIWFYAKQAGLTEAEAKPLIKAALNTSPKTLADLYIIN
jgi:hypothetical protein